MVVFNNRIRHLALCTVALSLLGENTDTVLAQTMPADSPESPAVLKLAQMRLAKDGRIDLSAPGKWKFHIGDNPDWAKAEFDDRSWRLFRFGTEVANPAGEVVWYRLRLAVEPGVWDTPLFLQCAGEDHVYNARELYWNGELIDAYGEIGTPLPEGKTNWKTRRRDCSVPISFSRGTEHVLAVRYADKSSHTGTNIIWGPPSLWVNNAHSEIATRVEYEKARGLQGALAAALCTIFLVHLFLFAFYPADRGNLYYALCIGFLAAFVFFYRHKSLTASMVDLPAVFALFSVFGARFLYSIFYSSLPKQFWLFPIGWGLGLGGYILFEARFFKDLIEILFGFFIVEILRVVLVSIFKKKDGAWIVGTGFTIFAFSLLGFLYLNYRFYLPDSEEAASILRQQGLIMATGVIGLFIPMSIYLARNVGRTNRGLKTQLIQIEELSQQNLLQERALREEVEKELRDARDMQMGLMPKEAPRIPGVRLAGRCLPASQVGGDFFQYFPLDRDRLSIALADATGHAMKAAVPVMMFSGILKSQMELGDAIEPLFARLNRTLHQALDSRTFICFTMAEFNPESRALRMSNCGCPYPYHYKAATSEIVELQVDAYPLGIRADATYETIETRLAPEDRVVFCSDGIIEAENAAGEIFTFERTAEAIRTACREGLSAEALLERIIGEVKAFTEDKPQGDDQTVVVLHVEA